MINFDKFEFKISKHFRNNWMRKWDWDLYDLKQSLKESYAIEKVGNYKYEAYTKYKTKGKSRKLVFVIYKLDQTLYIITGTEGGKI